MAGRRRHKPAWYRYAGQPAEVCQPHVLHTGEGAVSIVATTAELVGATEDGPAFAGRGGGEDNHVGMLVPEVGEVLHEGTAEFLSEEIVRGGGGAAEGEEDTVGGGEVAVGRVGMGEEGGAVGEHGQGMGNLSLWKEGDGDGNGGIVVLCG